MWDEILTQSYLQIPTNRLGHGTVEGLYLSLMYEPIFLLNGVGSPVLMLGWIASAKLRFIKAGQTVSSLGNVPSRAVPNIA